MLRVLYWAQCFHPHVGGIELPALWTMARLVQQGFRFAVVTSRIPQELPESDEHLGIPIHRFPFQQALGCRDVEALMQIRRGIAQLKDSFQPQVVHVAFNDASPAFHLSGSSKTNVPTLVSLHGPPSASATLPASLAGELLGRAAWITTESRKMLHELHEAVPGSVGRSSCIYNAREVPSDEPTPLPWDPPVLLCLGRLHHQKNVSSALRAFANILQVYRHARLMIGGDGPERQDLERLVGELDIAGAVDFLGMVDSQSVPGFMNRATAVLMPSRYEGLPGVAIEAGMMGRPVVATRVDGIPEVVLDGKTGLLVEKEDDQGLTSATLRLLADRELAERFGREARAWTCQTFNWDIRLRAYAEAYRTLAC